MIPSTSVISAMVSWSAFGAQRYLSQAASMLRIFSRPAGISSCTALTLTFREYSFLTSTLLAVLRWYEAVTLKFSRFVPPLTSASIPS